MPFAKKENGYPVDAVTAATAVVEKVETASGPAPRIVAQGTTTQPSAKDRSIIRQTAWKIVGPAMANWTGSPEAWFEKALEYRAKVEKDMLEA